MDDDDPTAAARRATRPRPSAPARRRPAPRTRTPTTTSASRSRVSLEDARPHAQGRPDRRHQQPGLGLRPRRCGPCVPTAPAPTRVTTVLNSVTVDEHVLEPTTTARRDADGSSTASSPGTPTGSSGDDWSVHLEHRPTLAGRRLPDQRQGLQQRTACPARTRQETVMLNRFPPTPPKPVAGGRTNGSARVEFEWAANSRARHHRLPASTASTQSSPVACRHRDAVARDVLRRRAAAARRRRSSSTTCVAYDRDPGGNVLRRQPTQSAQLRHAAQQPAVPQRRANLAAADEARERRRHAHLDEALAGGPGHGRLDLPSTGSTATASP